MRLKRYQQHILFWLIYFLVGLFNELYLSSSFSLHPSWSLFGQSALSFSLVLGIKMLVVYFFLYRLIPLWISPGKKSTAILQSLFVLLVGTLLIRLTLRYIIWPFIFEEMQDLSPLRLLARYFYSLLDLLQILGLAVAIKLYQLRMNALGNEKNLVREKLQAEILHLKAQINPHFLFNTLNGIYTMARSKSDLTAEALMKLSHILRYILYEAGNKTVLLNKEVKVIEDYIALQKLRFGQRVNVGFSYQNQDEKSLIAPLLLLPLLENAFKHSNDSQANICFTILETPEGLFVHSRNNLMKESIDTKDEYKGIGLANVQRQLELLYKKFTFDHREIQGEFILDLFIDLNSYAGIEMFDHRR